MNKSKWILICILSIFCSGFIVSTTTAVPVVDGPNYVLNTPEQRKKLNDAFNLLKKTERSPTFKRIAKTVDTYVPEKTKELARNRADSITKQLIGGVPSDWGDDWLNTFGGFCWNIVYYTTLVCCMFLGLFCAIPGAIIGFTLAIIPAIAGGWVLMAYWAPSFIFQTPWIQQLIAGAFATFGLCGVAVVLVCLLPLVAILWVLLVVVGGTLMGITIDFECVVSVLNRDEQPPTEW